MASTFVHTLPATVLVTVIIPGLSDFNITNSRISVNQLPQQSQPATLPDGYVAHPDIEAAYKVYNEDVTWATARRRCIAEGARLADIDTHLKFEYVMNHLISNFAWTSIHKQYGDTEWVSSSTGLAVTTLPWAPNEPRGENYCVAASKLPRGLVNGKCGFNCPYVCELPILKNNAQGIDELAKIVAN